MRKTWVYLNLFVVYFSLYFKGHISKLKKEQHYNLKFHLLTHCSFPQWAKPMSQVWGNFHSSRKFKLLVDLLCFCWYRFFLRNKNWSFLQSYFPIRTNCKHTMRMLHKISNYFTKWSSQAINYKNKGGGY